MSITGWEKHGRGWWWQQPCSLVGCGLSKTPLSLGWAVFQKHLLLASLWVFMGLAGGICCCVVDPIQREGRAGRHYIGMVARNVRWAGWFFCPGFIPETPEFFKHLQAENGTFCRHLLPQLL